ncbi:MAG TPA: hypothetical protein V6D34_06990 [Candidatus Sericytochromatia bacterium]
MVKLSRHSTALAALQHQLKRTPEPTVPCRIFLPQGIFRDRYD